MLRDMAAVHNSPPKISELIDRIDLIREELLSIQMSMEKIEAAKAPVPIAKGKKK
jgi:hypothetical protein